MASDAAKKPYMKAAMFYVDHNLDLKKAASWMEAAIKPSPTPSTSFTVSQKFRPRW